MVNPVQSDAEVGANAPGRIPLLDVARTAALVAMALFHFVYDLELFGYLVPGTAVSGGWRALAVATAGSFLFLAGVSLWLAHGRSIRWRGFWRRWVMVAGAAALITVATVLAIPQAFIFFGILHCIALCSLLGLALLRLPAAALAVLAVVAFWAPDIARHPIFDAPALWWTGLQTVPIRAVDYVPLLPWMAPFLAGLALGRIGDRTRWWSALASGPTPEWQWWLGWPGRHSLVIYLAHQPVLIALIWSVTQIMR